jgi:hypothetical protein
MSTLVARVVSMALSRLSFWASANASACSSLNPAARRRLVPYSQKSVIKNKKFRVTGRPGFRGHDPEFKRQFGSCPRNPWLLTTDFWFLTTWVAGWLPALVYFSVSNVIIVMLQ